MTMLRLHPFAHRHRRRGRRRSATTDKIVSTQHASALAAVSMRSEDGQHEARTLQALETARKAAESGDLAIQTQRATAEYLVGLSKFFYACDYDEDGALLPAELQIMIEILQQVKTLTRQSIRLRRRSSGETMITTISAQPPPPTIVVEDPDETDHTRRKTTLEQFMERYGHKLYAAGVDLPPVDFVKRCQRVKIGFKRCDTNDDHVISFQELEIALQKLDIVVADDELDQLVHTLDANGDGAIEWSEMVRAAWMNTHLGLARNRNSVFCWMHWPMSRWRPLDDHEIPSQLTPLIPTNIRKRRIEYENQVGCYELHSR